MISSLGCRGRRIGSLQTSPRLDMSINHSLRKHWLSVEWLCPDWHLCGTSSLLPTGARRDPFLHPCTPFCFMTHQGQVWISAPYWFLSCCSFPIIKSNPDVWATCSVSSSSSWALCHCLQTVMQKLGINHGQKARMWFIIWYGATPSILLAPTPRDGLEFPSSCGNKCPFLNWTLFSHISHHHALGTPGSSPFHWEVHGSHALITFSISWLTKMCSTFFTCKPCPSLIINSNTTFPGKTSPFPPLSLL